MLYYTERHGGVYWTITTNDEEAYITTGRMFAVVDVQEWFDGASFSVLPSCWLVI